ncbi:MAG: response regulator [Burkholderiales bacterium]|nr:response regulator [Burkholderiales bacterium]
MHQIKSRLRRVLLVDDDESLRRALARAVRLAGFDVATFASVEALIAHGMPERDACLVLDVDLPGISGIALKQALADANRDLPVIFITALDARDVDAQLARLEPVAVLYKPFEKGALLAAIERASG